MNYELNIEVTARHQNDSKPYRHIELFHPNPPWNLSQNESDGLVCATIKNQIQELRSFVNCSSTDPCLEDHLPAHVFVVPSKSLIFRRFILWFNPAFSVRAPVDLVISLRWPLARGLLHPPKFNSWFCQAPKWERIVFQISVFQRAMYVETLQVFLSFYHISTFRSRNPHLTFVWILAPTQKLPTIDSPAILKTKPAKESVDCLRTTKRNFQNIHTDLGTVQPTNILMGKSSIWFVQIDFSKYTFSITIVVY